MATYCEIVVAEKDSEAECMVSVDAHSQRKEERVQMMVFECGNFAANDGIMVLMTNEKARAVARALINAADRNLAEGF